jgi:hypothetical protein
MSRRIGEYKEVVSWGGYHYFWHSVLQFLLLGIGYLSSEKILVII